VVYRLKTPFTPQRVTVPCKTLFTGMCHFIPKILSYFNVTKLKFMDLIILGIPYSAYYNKGFLLFLSLFGLYGLCSSCYYSEFLIPLYSIITR